MKRLLSFALTLACVLLLIGCNQAPADAENPMEEPKAEERIPLEKEEITPQPGGQEAAIRAYGQILDSVGGLLPHEQGYPGYPEEFADAYYQDGYLNVCLTENTLEMREKYRALVDEPQILRFEEVAYSYNDLYALYMASISLMEEEVVFTSGSIDITENCVELGIPDITKETEVLALILENLPQDMKDRFPEYPIVFCEEEFAQLAMG